MVYEKSFQAAVDEAVAQSGNPNVPRHRTVVPLTAAAADSDDHDRISIRTSGWIRTNMVLITDAVRDKLAAVDPGHAADYTERAAALTAGPDRT